MMTLRGSAGTEHCGRLRAMCTERSPDEIVVCDVAIADVRGRLADLVGVSFVHLPYEGTLVANAAGADTIEFRRRLNDAIVGHGGGLSGNV